MYFLIEIIDEIILSSAGLIATHYFNWTISQVNKTAAASQSDIHSTAPC